MEKVLQILLHVFKEGPICINDRTNGTIRRGYKVEFGQKSLNIVGFNFSSIVDDRETKLKVSVPCTNSVCVNALGGSKRERERERDRERERKKERKNMYVRVLSDR